MQKKGCSLSDIIENYRKVVVTEKADLETEIAPLAKSLKGSFKMPVGFDYKEQLRNKLAEKYLK